MLEHLAHTVTNTLLYLNSEVIFIETVSDTVVVNSVQFAERISNHCVERNCACVKLFVSYCISTS